MQLIAEVFLRGTQPFPLFYSKSRERYCRQRFTKGRWSFKLKQFSKHIARISPRSTCQRPSLFWIRVAQHCFTNLKLLQLVPCIGHLKWPVYDRINSGSFSHGTCRAHFIWHMFKEILKEILINLNQFKLARIFYASLLPLPWQRNRGWLRNASWSSHDQLYE